MKESAEARELRRVGHFVLGNAMLGSFKEVLTLIGARLSDHSLHQLQRTINYMKLGKWVSKHNFRFSHRVRHRDNVFAAVAKQVCDKRVLYLEFGVFQGASMRYWSGALKHPKTKLHGFDSFEGLPEDVDSYGPYRKGTFSVQGAVPTIDDARVHFFKGWFDEVLPTYAVPEHDVLVINIDTDLYSSTIYVLRHLRPWIRAGTFIYFDDLSLPEHETKAFAEFMKESGLKFSPVCADQSLNRAFFQCMGGDVPHGCH